MNDLDHKDWYQFIFELRSEDIQITEKIFADHNVISITYNDASNNPIYEPLPGEVLYWEQSSITGLFPLETDFKSLKDALITQLNIKELPNNKIIKITGREWQKEWTKDLKPMQFGKRLWVCPYKTNIKKEGASIVYLDPGLAFGTGSHPTTRLCLEWLESIDIGKKKVLDFGCGSGILGISALKLGAMKVSAIDIDPQAIQATKKNAKKNNVTNNIKVMQNCPRDSEKFDVIVANILAKPLIELVPIFAKKIKRKGLICISGILEDQTKLIKENCNPFIEFSTCKLNDGWVMLSGQAKR